MESAASGKALSQKNPGKDGSVVQVVESSSHGDVARAQGGWVAKIPSD